MTADDAVERAARALNEEGWTCHGGEHEPGHYDECEDCQRVDRRAARAALAAARAGEAEGWTAWAERVAEKIPEDYVDGETERDIIERGIDRLLIELGRHWDEGFAAGQHPANADQRGGVLVDEAPDGSLVFAPAERGGEAADREALIDHVRATLARTDERDEQVVDAILAARGDAAPTVSPEQVERARLSEPMTYPPGQQVSRSAAHHLLAALGIEVRP